VSSEPLPGCFQENALTCYSFNDRGIVDEKIDLTGIQNMNMNEISLVLRCSIVRSNMDTNEEATKYEDIHIDVQSSQFENEVLERNAKKNKLKQDIQELNRTLTKDKKEIGDKQRQMEEENKETELDEYFEEEAPHAFNNKEKVRQFEEWYRNKTLYDLPCAKSNVAPTIMADEDFIAASLGEMFSVDAPDLALLLSMFLMNYDLNKLVVIKKGGTFDDGQHKLQKD
jgi:hypothetical protein